MPARLGVMPPLSPGIYLRPTVKQRPFPLDTPGCVLFERARHGLWYGLQALGLTPEDEVLVPAYHHGSEVEALIRAGLSCRFYEATDTLAPDESELEALLGPRTRALHLIHYLGFAQDAPRWQAWCQRRGLALIEDAAQGWLGSLEGRPLGSFGDIAIFCLYKTVGVPDGAALLCSSPPPPPDGRRRAGIGPLALRHAAWCMERSPMLAELAVHLARPSSYSPEEDFALGDPNRPPSSATLHLLGRFDPNAAARRRANYRFLLGELGDLVPSPFGAIGDGASPFAFPIEADDKPALLARLAAGGVRGLNLWSVPHPALPAARFPAAARRRARVVGLPVHQELRGEDLARIARAVR